MSATVLRGLVPRPTEQAQMRFTAAIDADTFMPRVVVTLVAADGREIAVGLSASDLVCTVGALTNKFIEASEISEGAKRPPAGGGS